MDARSVLELAVMQFRKSVDKFVTEEGCRKLIQWSLRNDPLGSQISRTCGLLICFSDIGVGCLASDAMI